MSRKPLIVALVLFALLEVGILLTGYHGRRPSTAAPGKEAVASKAEPAAPLRLYAEPDAGFGWLYTLVNNASTTVDLTMYELVDAAFSADLVAACKRGVKVRVILDQSREKTANTPAFNQLRSAGPNCDVAWSNPQFQATHEKSMVVDNSTAAIMTFNTTSRYYSSTRDFGLLTTDKNDVAAIETTFNTDFQSTTDLGFQPPAGTDLIWSPTTAQSSLLSVINSAQRTLLVENEELSAAAIVSALAAACKRGVKLSLAMTDTSANYHANYSALQQAGCGVHVGANNASTLYIHAKVIVADAGTATANGYVGSINFSVASMTKNRELGLFVHDPGTLQQLATTVTSDFTQFPAFSASTHLPNTEPVRP